METKCSGKCNQTDYISVHKCILASGSEYFMEVYRTMGANAPDPLLIPDPAPLDKFEILADDHFSHIIKYLYAAQVRRVSL